MLNNVVLIGRICNELELKGNENKVVNFNLAVNGYKDKTDFIPVAVFGNQAESLVKYQGRGSQIAISGHISQDTYTLEDGSRRNSIKVIANRVQFLGSKANTSTVSEADIIGNHLGFPASVGEASFQVIEDDDIPF